MRDKRLFSQVPIIDYAGCLEWPTGADFDPETVPKNIDKCDKAVTNVHGADSGPGNRQKLARSISPANVIPVLCSEVCH